MATRNTFLNVSKTRVYEKAMGLMTRNVYFSQQNAAVGDIFQVLPVITGDVVLAVWAEVITACNSNAKISLGYGGNATYWGNKLIADAVGHCRSLLHSTMTWNAYHIADKSELTNEIEIPGAAYGDHVTVSSGMDIADMSLSGEVIHPGWAAVHLVNNTGGGLNLASQTMSVAVNKAPQMASPKVFAESDTIDITADTAITQGVITLSALIFRK